MICKENTSNERGKDFGSRDTMLGSEKNDDGEIKIVRKFETIRKLCVDENFFKV